MNIVKELRSRHGMTLAEVADRTGLRVTSVWRHEAGQRAISAASALRYAKVFGVPLEAILSQPITPAQPQEAPNAP